MRLKELKIHNFRNISDRKLKFSNRNLIFGKNGSGKTNILEAIHLVCVGKSFRLLSNQDLIKRTATTGDIFAVFDRPEKTKPISQSIVFLPKNQQEIKKEFYRNNKKIPTLKFLGRFPVVLFAPEELKIVWGSPHDRRTILDLLIAQYNPIYASKLLKLSQVTRQRNKLLFLIKTGRASRDELNFWDQELITTGSQIIQARNQTILSLGRYLKIKYREISGTKDEVTMDLDSTVSIALLENNLQKIKQAYQSKLEKSLSADLEYCSTNIGPHRDNPKLLLNTQDIGHFGSRGEGKTAVLALKFAQKELYRSLLDTEPLFLLDDAFSELDSSRIHYLLENLSAEQSIFTAAVMPENTKNFQIIEL